MHTNILRSIQIKHIYIEQMSSIPVRYIQIDLPLINLSLKPRTLVSYSNHIRFSSKIIFSVTTAAVCSPDNGASSTDRSIMSLNTIKSRQQFVVVDAVAVFISRNVVSWQSGCSSWLW